VHFGLESNGRDVDYLRPSQSERETRLTVFIGIYNAMPFISDLLSSLGNQNWTADVHLLLVDNASTDGSWQLLKESLLELPCQVTLVSNRVNLGALGSIYRNADLIKSEWMTFIHQDDLYLPNFLKSCLREIEVLRSEKVSTISFDYFTVAGKEPASHSPNPTWFAKGWPAHVAFLENLSNHSVPWPCTVFKSEYLLESPVPFHSSAFLDTEIALNQVTAGRHLYVSEKVMNYRIHGESGSHSLPSGEAEILRSTSILRVANSKDFAELVRTIPVSEQATWMSDVILAAEGYVESMNLKNLLRLSIAEAIVLALDYRNPSCNQILAAALDSIGAKGSARLMKGLSGAEGSSSQLQMFERTKELNPVMAESRPVRRSIWRVASKLPRFLVVLIFRLVPKRFIPRPWSSFK
jgi:glycosyltransferase involved in cell wall biosynthesis